MPRVWRAGGKLEPGGRYRMCQSLRKALALALVRKDYATALTATNVLVRYCCQQGRFREALKIAEDRIEYAHAVGQGPFTPLAAEGTRLNVLAMMGRTSGYWPTCGGSSAAWTL